MSWDSRRSFNPRKRDVAPGRGPRRVSASNAVVSAIMQCAAVHGQPCFRMQSRMFEVTGEDGRIRPMWVGAWTDRFGEEHYGGMADCLCTPTIELRTEMSGAEFYANRVQVALWCEAKAGTGRLTEKQILFRENVEATGGEYLLCHDSAEALMDWFKNHRLVRP